MSEQKPAYLIGSSIIPEGHGSLEPYGNAVHALFEKAGAEVLVFGKAGQRFEHFEGNWPKDAAFTLFRFPSG